MTNDELKELVASLAVDSVNLKVFIKDWERLSRSGRYDLNRLRG